LFLYKDGSVVFDRIGDTLTKGKKTQELEKPLVNNNTVILRIRLKTKLIDEWIRIRHEYSGIFREYYFQGNYFTEI